MVPRRRLPRAGLAAAALLALLAALALRSAAPGPAPAQSPSVTWAPNGTTNATFDGERLVANDMGYFSLVSQYWNSPAAECTPYSLSIRIKRGTGINSVEARLSIVDADGISAVKDANASTEWQTVTTDETQPTAGSEYLQVTITADAAAAGATLHIDSPVITDDTPTDCAPPPTPEPTPDVTPEPTAEPTAASGERAGDDPPPATGDPPPEASPPLGGALANAGFEDGLAPWKAHGGEARTASSDGGRLAVLKAEGGTAWLHQALRVEPGAWYEAGARLSASGGTAWMRVAWYASDDGGGSQLDTADSPPAVGGGFEAVTTGAVRAPEEARSARLRLMLRPAGGGPATLRADDASFARAEAPPPEPPPEASPTPEAAPTTEASPPLGGSLANAGFEDGLAPWKAHGGEARTASSDGGRHAVLTAEGGTAWLHQALRVEPGAWYEAGARLSASGGTAWVRVAWYASDDGGGSQLDTADSPSAVGGEGFGAVTTGAVRAPEEARSARLRLMLRPAGGGPATLRADGATFARAEAPSPEPPPEASPTPEASPPLGDALANAGFEDGLAPWKAHGGEARAAPDGGGGRLAVLTAEGGTAWLHQALRVEPGAWYEAGARLRASGGTAWVRVAWYASDDGGGSQLDTADSPSAEGGEGFEAVTTGAVRAPEEARSARLRLMLRPAGGGPASLRAASASFARAAAPPPEPPPEASPAPEASPTTPEASPTTEASPTAEASPAAEAAAPAAASADGDGEAEDAPAQPSPPAGTPPPDASAAFALRVTALLPNPVQPGQDAAYEWVEITNVGRTPLRLGGFVLRDNAGEIALPDVELPAGGSIVVAGASAEVGDAVAVRLAGGLFNGLANGGDRLALYAPGGGLVDALSWGADASHDSPPLDAPGPGEVLRRRFAPDGAPLAAGSSGDAADGGGALAAEATAPAPADGAPPGEGGTNRAAWIGLTALAAASLGGVFAFRFRDLLRGGE